MDTSTYLLALYVTQEQEAAIQSMFFTKQWMFCKTDADRLISPRKVVYKFESLDCITPIIKTEPDFRQKTVTLYGDLNADEPRLVTHGNTTLSLCDKKSEPVLINDDLCVGTNFKLPDVKLRGCSVSLTRVSVPITGNVKVESSDSTPEPSAKKRGRPRKHPIASTSTSTSGNKTFTPAKESSTPPKVNLPSEKGRFISNKKKFIPSIKSLTSLKNSLTPAKQLKKDTVVKKNLLVKFKNNRKNTRGTKSKTNIVYVNNINSENQTVNTFTSNLMKEANLTDELEKHEKETHDGCQGVTDSKIANEIVKEDSMKQSTADDNDNNDDDYNGNDDNDFNNDVDEVDDNYNVNDDDDDVGDENDDYNVNDDDIGDDDDDFNDVSDVNDEDYHVDDKAEISGDDADDDNVDGEVTKDPDYGTKFKLKKKKRKVRKVFECEKCNKRYKNELSFKTHQSSDCGTKKVKKRKVVEDSGRGSFHCETCKKIFAYKRKYLKHYVDGVCRYKCKYCGKVCTSTLKRHIFYKHEVEVERLRCEICNRRVFDNLELKEHMQSHSESKNYICDQCGQAFQTQISLYAHDKRVHEESTTNHECEICHKVLSSSSGLTYHKRVTHSDERNCVCEICGKRFKTARCVKTHMIMHSDVKPYHCDICNKDYKYGHQLYSHKRIYHRHIRRYFCTVCNKGYYFEGLLKDHMNVHNGIKAHSCSQCDYTSYTREQMTQHRRKHRDPAKVKVEQIPVAEETFAVSSIPENF